MSNINKDAVLNPFSDLTANILNYVPRATTSEFGIVAIGSGINVDALGRIYLDTQEYSDRLAAIEAQAASSLATQQTEVAAAIAQVNLAQSQTITALTLEVSNLKTDLTNSITATQTDLVNRADQLAQDVTDITVQLTQDKATFNQEIQDALVYLQNEASVASALRTPRKIQGVDFDGTQDINLPIFSTQIDGLVPKRVGATTTKYLREDGTWVVPTDTTYALLTKASAEVGTATTANTISAQVLKEAIQYHAPTVTNIVGNAGTATKLQTPRTINGVLFDGTQNISLPEAVAYSLPTASASVLGGIKVGSGLAISNSVLSVDTLNQSTTGNAATSSKLQTARTIGGISFDGTTNINLPGVNTTGNQNTSGNAGSASKLATARTLTVGRTGKAFDGSVNIAWTITEVLPTATSGQFLKFDGTTWIAAADNDTTYSAMSQAEANTGTDTSNRVITAAVLKEAIQTHAPVQTTITGNAGTATKLATARTINGVAFDGTANITIADSTKIAKGEFGLGVVEGGVTPTFTATTINDTASWYSGVIRYADVALPGTYGHGIRIGGGTTGSNGGWFNDILFSTNGTVHSRFKTNTTDWSGWTTHITSANIGLQTVASATSLATARTINGVSFDGTANINLDVYSKAETDSIAATPNATETVAGKAKIATTAIAKAGTDDTDFITAKKLRGALSASGNAPISACRAWVVFTCVSNVVTILNSMNILSVTRLGTSNFKITYATPMPTANNVPLASGQVVLGTNNQYAAPPAIRNILAESCEVYHYNPSADFPLVTLGVFC